MLVTLPICSLPSVPPYLFHPIYSCPFSSITSYLSPLFYPFPFFPSLLYLPICPSLCYLPNTISSSVPFHLSLPICLMCLLPSVPSHLRFCTFPTVPSHLSLSLYIFYQVPFYEIRPPNHLSLSFLHISNCSPIIVSLLLLKKII